MSGPFGAGALNFFSGAAEFYPYTIDQSVRFNAADSAYLEKTFSGTGNRRTFTISFWFKRCRTGTAEYLFAGGNDTSNRFHMDINASGTFQIEAKSGGSTQIKMEGGPVLRDVGAWYNFVLRVDTTQSTASDRVRLYVNGDLLTFNSNTYPSQNADLNWNLNDQVRIGLAGWNTTTHFDGYFAEFINVDGSSLAPTSFGETKAGIWVPKDYTGSYGTNGFKLAFQDSASLGDDTSGNSHDFTSSGLASTDQMLDSPTNNHPTINRLQPHGSILSDGNLTMDNNNRVVPMLATIGVSSGKWAWKVTINTQNAWGIGISTAPRADDNSGGLGYVSYEYSYDTWDGDKRNNNTQSAYGVSVSSGGNVEVLLDLDAGTLSFKANGSDQGTAYSGLSGTFFPAFANWAASGAGDTIDVDFGQGGYTPPSGYELLNAANLPAPGIDPAEDEAPTDYFNTVLYSGNSSTNNITGVGFRPDWVWVKARNATGQHSIFDVVRGATKRLGDGSPSVGTAVESTVAASLQSFDSDGFTFGNESGNNSGENYVAWNWKAGGTAVSNTDGSITSSVSASPESGFSIVTYTGTGANATVGHGLGKAPDMIILKKRANDTQAWQVYHSANTSEPETEKLTFNTTAATVDDNTTWNDTAPTSTVFSIGTGSGTNENTDTYVAYCFADIDGMVKAGSYTGNSSTTFVYTGFRPAFVMIKSNNQTRNWIVFDNKRTPTNQMDGHLHPNASVAEQTGSDEIDFLSNGFNLRSPDNDTNTSAFEYIYIAFAEQPFKYANAR